MVHNEPVPRSVAERGTLNHTDLVTARANGAWPTAAETLLREDLLERREVTWDAAQEAYRTIHTATTSVC